MDLEEMDNVEVGGAPTEVPSNLSATEALKYLDTTWYTEASRKARWMDLIGDYAGNERFILDGDAVLQNVLDDPLLAIGRPKDPSFQVLHARYSLERTLENFLRRGAVFDVVFWESNRHITLRTGSTKYEMASRTLARTMLVRHLALLNVSVYVFKDMSDRNWIEYIRLQRPMFVMTNDGGQLHCPEALLAERILLQRNFWFLLLSGGLSVALLRNAVYRDSKILAFLYEERRQLNAHARFPQPFWDAHDSATKTLETFEISRRFWDRPILEQCSPAPSTTPISQITDLCERYITVTKPDLLSLAFLQAFVIHLLLLDSVPIEDRAQRLSIDDGIRDSLVSSFLPSIFCSLESVILKSGWNPDVDTRLYVRLLDVLCHHRQAKLSDVVGKDVTVQTEEIWTNLSLTPVDFSILATKISPPSSVAVEDFPSSTAAIKVLPFDNDVFNEELAAVRVETDDTTDVPPPGRLEFGGGTPFMDTQHWHNHRRNLLPKHLGGEDARPKDARALRKQLKRNQRFMANMQKHASTLTGASGTQLQQQVITPIGSSRTLAQATKAKTKANLKTEAPKKGKAQQLTSKERILQSIQKEKKMKEDDSSSTWWHQRLSGLDKMTVRERIEELQSLSRNKHAQDGWLSLEIHLYRLHLEILKWVEDPAREEPKVTDAYCIWLMCSITKLCGRKRMSSIVFTCFESVLHALGFGNYIKSLKSTVAFDSSLDRPLSFNFVKVVGSKTKSPLYKFMSITENPITWQLRLFGEYMDRSMDSQSDTRVPFEPDGWQREVLDCLDTDKSVLVVAPTSAGKTFISYYAMEKVLKNSDDGVLVYVAPTKALVNQIAAEVYARFSKDLGNRSCWAIHTRDYRIHNPQNCQILVTVPEMLAIMLLSPALSRVWTPRIKRIILDEIHTIGQQEGGVVWEQILLLAPCPVIGLSATIGYPEDFNRWLESVQRAHGFEHAFIHHPHRYSHLRKHVYVLPLRPSKFAGLDAHKASDRLRFLHPITMLGFGTPSLPPDLSLEAGDTLTLFRAMCEARNAIPADLDSVDPLNFFSNSRLLRQKDILDYEYKLKEILAALILSPDSAEATSPLQQIVRSLQDPVLAKIPDAHLNNPPSPTRFLSGLPQLLADLHCANNLPALFFSFDRHNCEVMAKVVLQALENAEVKWRESSPEWQTRLKAWEAWKARSARQARTAERQKKQKKDPDDETSLPTGDVSWESSFNPSDPSPQFSFADHRKYSRSELMDDLKEFAWTSTPGRAYDALKRGIGVHHSGMNKAYRSAVESLFRRGYLRVVFATGTLALGINAPAKTSVFCGDSPFLTALMFRQCAGRAGRRGYDLLGNVVFYGLPIDRVQRLVLSKLPRLSGSFPLSSTLCLRLFNLLHGSDNAEVAVKSIQSLFKLPQISFGSDTRRDELLHHFRFSVDYLRRAGLLDLHGRPMNLFAIAAHLFHTDPSNLALVTLLRHGVMHEICGQSSFIKAKTDFMVIMCHLFGRRYLPNSYANEATLRQMRTSNPSRIVLPSLPTSVRNVLVEHNTEILRVFSAYAFLYASQRRATLGREAKLPLSDINIGKDISTFRSCFHQSIHQTAIPLTSRSPFVANSGHPDQCASVGELVRTCHRGLHLNDHAIPSLEHIVDGVGESNESAQLNAYLLDFFTHGQTQSLVHANGIRRGDLWYVLQEFVLTLMTIRGALEQLLLKASELHKDVNVASEAFENLDVDGGFFSLDADTAEADEPVTDSDSGLPFPRPARVSDRDWKVYEVVNSVLQEFYEKFKKMWA